MYAFKWAGRTKEGEVVDNLIGISLSEKNLLILWQGAQLEITNQFQSCINKNTAIWYNDSLYWLILLIWSFLYLFIVFFVFLRLCVCSSCPVQFKKNSHFFVALQIYFWPAPHSLMVPDLPARNLYAVSPDFIFSRPHFLQHTRLPWRCVCKIWITGYFASFFLFHWNF